MRTSVNLTMKILLRERKVMRGKESGERKRGKETGKGPISNKISFISSDQLSVGDSSELPTLF